MHDFLTLFYPVVNAHAANDEAEIARLTEVKAGNPFYVVPGWCPASTATVDANVVQMQRARMQTAVITHLLERLTELKNCTKATCVTPEQGALVSTYMDAIVDASGYAGKSSANEVAAFCEQLWKRVTETGEWLIEASKLREVVYEEKELGPIRIMVITDPKLYRYLDLHNHAQLPEEQLMMAHCFDPRVTNKIIIAVGCMQQKLHEAEPYTFGTLKYTIPTKFKGVDELKSYVGYQMHFEFVDNIPALGVLEVQGLFEPHKPLVSMPPAVPPGYPV